MRIIDQDGNEITSPDYSMGYLIADRILIAHHPAVEAVEEQWHYEVIAEYPNGGKDLEKVIDVEAVDASEEWDEYEDVKRFIPYTDEELSEMKSNPKTSLEDRVAELEEAIALLLSGETK